MLKGKIDQKLQGPVALLIVENVDWEVSYDDMTSVYVWQCLIYDLQFVFRDFDCFSFSPL
jgi:hypothetical protein